LSLAYAAKWNSWYSQWEFYATERTSFTADAVINAAGLQSGTCVQGIRVLNGSPGFAAENHFPAIADSSGAGAPRTNVARSAIEKTAEYNAHLRVLYGAYISHVATEFTEMQSRRRCSVTKAAREAHFMLDGLISSRESQYSLVSRKLFNEAASLLPAFAVEVDGVRSPASLRDLAGFEKLLTVESSLTRHVEYVLAALPATTSFSSIMSAAGERVPYSEGVPLLSGLQASSNLTKLFMATWEISEIKLDEAERLVQATWKKREDGAPLYVSASYRPQWLPRALFRDSARYVRERPGRGVAPYVSTDGELIVSGLESYGSVRIGSRSIALPGAALDGIKPIDEQLPEQILAWCRSLIFYLASTELPRSPSKDSATQRVLHLIESGEIVNFVSMPSVAETMPRMNFDSFDSLNWERSVEK
jgi:hypothetical protein